MRKKRGKHRCLWRALCHCPHLLLTSLTACGTSPMGRYEPSVPRTCVEPSRLISLPLRVRLPSSVPAITVRPSLSSVAKYVSCHFCCSLRSVSTSPETSLTVLSIWFWGGGGLVGGMVISQCRNAQPTRVRSRRSPPFTHWPSRTCVNLAGRSFSVCGSAPLLSGSAILTWPCRTMSLAWSISSVPALSSSPSASVSGAAGMMVSLFGSAEAAKWAS